MLILISWIVIYLVDSVYLSTFEQPEPDLYASLYKLKSVKTLLMVLHNLSSYWKAICSARD